MSGLQELLVLAFSDYRVQMYMHLSGLVILFYDWVLSLPDEVKYIWKAKLSGIKIAFLFNRYILPIDILFAAYIWSGRATWLTASSCKTLLFVDNFIILTFFTILHYVVGVRTWTLYGRGGAAGIAIWGAFIADFVAAYYLSARVMMAIDAAPNAFGICVGFVPRYIWITWLPSIFFECFIFVLTVIKAREHSRERVDNTLLSIFYRDGFMYFIFITADSFVNLLVWALGRTSMFLIFRYFSAAICQAAGSHLILDLLSASKENHDDDEISNRKFSNPRLTTQLTDFSDFKSPGLFTSSGQLDSPKQFHTYLDFS